MGKKSQLRKRRQEQSPGAAAWMRPGPEDILASVPGEPPSVSELAALRELGRYFRRNGYVRRQNVQRLAHEGYHRYKKGDEVRLTAQDESELRDLQALLLQGGFRPGRPFVKGRQYRLPIYGREAVHRFLRLVQAPRTPTRQATAASRPERDRSR